MDKQRFVRLHAAFEEMVHTAPEIGAEFWCARELQGLMGYAQGRSFTSVVDKAIIACQNAGYDPLDHFAHIRKTLKLGSGAHDRAVIERHITSTDDEIDRIVYDLYGLTEEEISVVEATVRG